MADNTENINTSTTTQANPTVDLVLKYLNGELGVIENEIANNSLDLDKKNDKEQGLNDFAMIKVQSALKRYIQNIELLTAR